MFISPFPVLFGGQLLVPSEGLVNPTPFGLECVDASLGTTPLSDALGLLSLPRLSLE